jgi:tetratricopeptide (TPR) repeat protein
MRRDSLVLAVSGVFFGLLVGWIIGSQQGPGGQPSPAAPAAAAPAPSSGQTAAPLDETRARALQVQAESSAADAAVRVELGNLYFDAERYADAVRWYEDALRIDPKNVNASTDLGVAYYYMNQPDRALQQFDLSLSIDPKHAKTLLNQGIVRAFGKQDLTGAGESWEQVVAVAPDTPEGRAARQALDNMKSAHPPGVATSAPPKPPGQP